MKLIVALVLSVIIASCSDKTSYEQSANKAASGNSVSRQLASAYTTPATSQANAYRIGLSSFEIPFSEFLSHFKYDTTEVDDGWVRVYKANEPLFSLSDKNDLQDKRVRMIVIFSPDIQTENGVHVGMSIDELMQRFPSLSLDYCEEHNEECFQIPIGDVQTQTIGLRHVGIVAFVNSNRGNDIAKKGLKDLNKSEATGPWPYPTRDFSMEGKISKILILE